MGKSKQVQRTKGNFQPSSSAKAAELVTKTGGSLPGQFFNLSKFLKPQEELDVPYDTDFCYVLKKISKKDINTKRKGLQELGQLCSEKDVEVVASVLTYFIPHYTKLANDNDRRVREACQECFLNLSGKVKNKLAPHLKDLMATWLMAQCDGHLPSANMARRAFEVLFKESKQAEAVWFCRVEIIKQLSDTMFETNLQSIKDSDVCEADEAEGRLMRLQTSALDALSRFVQLLHPQFGSQTHEALDKLLSNREFWKLHKHATPNIRRAFYDLLSELCDRGTFGDDSPYREQASRSVLLCLDESNPHVLPALWKAVVSIFNVKNCWSFVNMNKAFLPKLFTMLDNGGYGCSEMIYPNLIILLDNLPDDVKTDDKFYFRFLSRFRNGLSQSSLMLNFRECNAVVKSFVECCKFIVYNFVENEMQNLASASVILKDYVVTLLTSALKDAKTTLMCSFKYVAEILWYAHKMSVKNKTFKDGGDEDKKRHAWMQVFKSAIDELAEVSKSLISGEVEDQAVGRLTSFYQSFLSFQNESANQNSRQRKIVTFKSSDLNKTTACDVNDSSLKSKVEIMEGYKLNESFKEFVHGLSSALFSEIKLKEQWMNRMKLFRMFFERFACEEFLSALKLSKSDSESGSAIHYFLKEVVCSWMTSADLTLFSEVTSIFLAALTLESEGERMTDLELALSELEEAKDAAGRSKLYKYLSLLFGSSDDRLIELWTRSEKCNESIVSSVIRCVDDFLDGGSHREAWSMICILLLRNEVNCPVSDARRKILSTIKEYLTTINPSEEKEEQTFVFVESIFSRLNEMDSLDSLKLCGAFDWLLDVLLWATIEPCTTSINSTSRKTLIATLEILLVGEEESDFKDSRLCCLMRSLLMYVNGHASRFIDLKEALETSKELMNIVYKHFKNFNFFTDFFYVPSVKVYDIEHSANGEVDGASWLQRLRHLQSHDYSQTRDSIIATQLFCAQLFNSLASSSRKEERVKESDDMEAEPTSTANDDEGVVCRDLSSHVLRNVNDDTHVISFINNTLDCIACLTFCDEKFKSTAKIHDVMSALDVLVPSLEDKLNFELIQQRVASCYVSQNEFTLNINSLALFMLLKKTCQMENSSYVKSMLSENICGKLLAVKDVSANVVRVVMAMICFVSPAVVGKLFDKFYEVVVNSRLESEGDLNETFMNSFAIINAILKTSEGSHLRFETDSESAPDNSKPSAPLFEKIDQARNFCEGFFAEEGKFVKKIGRTNTTVLNFYKNVISKFQIYPDLAEKHWDEILCFAVTRFEDLGSFCSSTDSEFSSELEAFVQSVMSITLDMNKMFTSKEFVEVSPRLADEWINVFQPTFYEYLNLFFINESKSKRLMHLDVLELLCSVVSQCPAENLDFHRIGLSPVDDDEAEVSFQMLLPLVESPNRYVQVCAYSLIKKLVPKKVEHLKSKFNEDGVDEQASTTSEESEPKPTHPSTFLPSLIGRFEALSMKFKSVDTMPSNDFKEKISDTYSDLRSYLLIFDLIAETFKSLPIAVKSSLSGWLSDGRIANHMSLLSSVMSKNPSEHLQQVAFDDIDLEISNKKGFDLSEHEMFYSFLGCSSSREGPVVPRLKVKGHESIVLGDQHDSQEVEQLSFRVFAKTVCAFPRIVRSWYSSLDQRSASQVDKFVTRYISPFYISKELSEVQQATVNQSDLNFQLKTHGRELTALYSADDASIVLSLTFPDNSPLTSLKVNLDHNRITSVKQISSAWTLQLTKLLNFKDGSLIEALMTMSRSIGRHFDGNSCMICYSLILNHQGTKVLPKVQCKTCKNKFHNNCLFTWFKSSNASNCPLCRSTF